MASPAKIVPAAPKPVPAARPEPVTIAAAVKAAQAAQAAAKPPTPPPRPRMVPLKPAQESAETRVAPRVEITGGYVRIDSSEYPVANISTSGFLLKPYEGSLIKLQKFYLTLVLPNGDKPLEFNASARVARVGPEGLGAYFLDLLPDIYRAIEDYMSRQPAAPPPKK